MTTTDDRVQSVGELVRNKTKLFTLHWNTGSYLVRFDTVNGRTVKMVTPVRPGKATSFYIPIEDISRRLEHIQREPSWIQKLKKHLSR